MATPYTSSVIWVAQDAIPNYVKVFNNATGSVTYFNSFKQNPVFLNVTGYTTADYAYSCLSHSKACPSASILPISAAKNDTYGSPLSLRVGGGKTLGWDTCRFSSTVAHVAENFGDMTGKSVYEWGCSYGGLMICMLQQWPNMDFYYINDLPEVVSFAQYYLAQNELSGPIANTTVVADITGSYVPTGSIDLFVSEYAMSEMDSGSMMNIYNIYGRNAQNILLRVNFNDFATLNKWQQIIEWDFGNVKVLKESFSRPQNRIIIGTKPKP